MGQAHVSASHAQHPGPLQGRAVEPEDRRTAPAALDLYLQKTQSTGPPGPQCLQGRLLGGESAGEHLNRVGASVEQRELTGGQQPLGEPPTVAPEGPGDAPGLHKIDPETDDQPQPFCGPSSADGPGRAPGQPGPVLY